MLFRSSRFPEAPSCRRLNISVAIVGGRPGYLETLDSRSIAEKGGFDLLVMGVMFRPSERRLYFGPKVEYILRNARCAFAVVVTPEKPSRA